MNYSTVQVAKKLGIGRDTLTRWIRDKKIKPLPKIRKVGGVSVRLWTDEDVARVRQYKAAHYRKGRGRKKAKK